MPNLKPVLREMLNLARQFLELPQRRTVGLDSGLVLEITQMKNGDVLLALSQSGQIPNVTQWRDVLYAWPEPIPVSGPVAIMRKEGRVYRSVLRWPRPAIAEPAL
jgi:hypothetical protein